MIDSASAKVCVVLVNWNGWQDCARCVDSLLLSCHQNFHIIICDNDSSDGSVEHLEEYCRENNITCSLKTVRELTREEAECLSTKVCLVPTGSNLGFAGGCNIGLRHVLAAEDYDYIWLLNNDTVVDKQAMTQMLEAAGEDDFDRPVGSQIHDLHGEQSLQVFGGQSLGSGPLINPRHCLTPDVDALDFLVGASIFLSRSRLQNLGLMDESYFLNAEDLAYTLDYQRTFRDQHPGITPFLVAGILWHNESSSQGQNRFLHSYYYSRNILFIAQKAGTLSLIVTSGHALLRSLKALCLLRFSTMRGILTGMAHAFTGRRGAYPGNI